MLDQTLVNLKCATETSQQASASARSISQDFVDYFDFYLSGSRRSEGVEALEINLGCFYIGLFLNRFKHYFDKIQEILI